MSEIEVKKESSKEKITEYYLKRFKQKDVESQEIPWRDLCELCGIPLAEFGSEEYIAHIQKRNHDKDSLNRYWRKHKIALLFTSGVPGLSLILHKGDDAAHAEIVRGISKACLDVSRTAIRYDEISQAEGISATASAALQKTRIVFCQTRMLLAKSVNNLGLPEPERLRLMNRLIPPGRWPWEKDDDYESQFLFG